MFDPSNKPNTSKYSTGQPKVQRSRKRESAEQQFLQNLIQHQQLRKSQYQQQQQQSSHNQQLPQQKYQQQQEQQQHQEYLQQNNKKQQNELQKHNQEQILQPWVQEQQLHQKNKQQPIQLGKGNEGDKQMTPEKQETYRDSISAPGSFEVAKQNNSSSGAAPNHKRWCLKYRALHCRHSEGLVPTPLSSELSCFNIYLIRAVCILIVGLVVLFIALFAYPFNRGFFCDDDSIRYPLMANTISTLMLAAFSFLLSFIVFFGVEGARLFDTSTPRDSWQTVISGLCRSLYEVFGVFVFGAGLNQVTVDVGKYSVGRLRPHFLDACRPFGQVCPINANTHEYVTDYECTGNANVIEEARLSFPSGHAALAFYSAVYVAVFLHYRLYWRSVKMIRHLMQGGVLILGWYTALSRVHDNMHHPSDVVAGGLIGTVWALLMSRFVIDLRLDSSHATKDELRSLRNPSHAQGANSV